MGTRRQDMGWVRKYFDFSKTLYSPLFHYSWRYFALISEESWHENALKATSRARVE